MPSLKRKIAEARVAKRKREREKIARDTYKLQLQRNKALKEAALAAKKAKALEEERQAKLKKLKAEERIKLQKQASRKQKVEKARKIAKSIVLTVRSVQKTARKRSSRY